MLTTRRSLTTSLLTLLILIGLLPGVAPQFASAAPPTTAKQCVQAGYVWVHVEWDGSSKGGCATKFETGLSALTSAGFAVGETGGFIHTIDGMPNPAGPQDWWSYWHKTPQADGSYPSSWEFSSLGAGNYKPKPGTVEGWHLWHSYSAMAQPPTINPVADVVVGTIPSFDTQPASVTVEAGSNASFTASASGVPEPTLAWSTSTDGTTWKPVAGATSGTLVLDKVTTSQDGLRIKATATNAIGSKDSTIATLTVKQESAVVTFPDAGLSQCVAQAVGVPADQLTQGKVAAITDLTCVNTKPAKIADLTGMGYLSGLKTLNLNTNAITDLAPLSGLTRLTKLWVSGNALDDISATAALINLEDVMFSRNNLKSVAALTTMTKLREASIDYNAITDLTPLSGKTKLTRLVANRNQIVSLAPLADVTSLTVLTAMQNKIVDVSPLSTLTKLTTLSLAYNQISDVVPLAKLTSLESLDVGNNALLDVSSLKDLKPKMLGFKARGQKVTLPAAQLNQGYPLPPIKDRAGKAPAYLKADGANASNVTIAGGSVTYSAVADAYTIAFSDSASSKIGNEFGGVLEQEVVDRVAIPDANFRKCLNGTLSQSATAEITATQAATIKTVDCFYAGVSDITGAKYLTNVETFKLSLSKVTDVSPLAGLTKLSVLDLDSNKVADASKAAPLPALTELNLNNNMLASFDALAAFPTLTKLAINNQGGKAGVNPGSGGIVKPTSVAGLGGLSELVFLDASQNAITTLEPITKLGKLSELRVFSNKLDDISPVAQLASLTALNVHSNQLTDLSPVSKLTGLTDINARNNKITSVAPLASVKGVIKLELSLNPITDAQTLSGLPELTDLGLEETGLTSVAFVSGLPKLNWIILHSNHLTDLSPLKVTTLRGWGALKQTVTAPPVEAGVATPLPVVTTITGDAAVVTPPADAVVANGRVTYPNVGDATVKFTDKAGSGAKFTGTITQPVVTAIDRPKAAAAWLYAQTVDGAMPGSNPGSKDWGSTVDALFALEAAGAPAEHITALGNAIEAHAGDYATYDAHDEPGVVIAGAMGKLLVAASMLNRDVNDFGGIDLRARALATVGADGVKGQVSDINKMNNANLFGQSLVMIGLARTGDLPADTVTFLTTQQCSAGYFRIFYTDGLSCDEAQGSPDRDATAMGIMALRAAKAKGISAADAPLAKAAAWLLTDQHPNGAFVGSPWTPKENSNSSGLVAAALSGLEPGAVEKITTWMTGLQLTASNGGAAAAESGAIAYDTDTFGDAVANGMASSTRQTWRYATAQAIFAFAPIDLYHLAPGSHAGKPDYLLTLNLAAVTAGESVQVTGRGFRPMEKVSLEVHSDPVAAGTLTADANGEITGAVTIPASVPEGEHRFVATGADSGVSLDAALNVHAGAAPPTPPATPSAQPTDPAAPAATPSAPGVVPLPGTGGGTLPLAALVVGALVATALIANRARKTR